jgi:hypothetical protein
MLAMIRLPYPQRKEYPMSEPVSRREVFRGAAAGAAVVLGCAGLAAAADPASRPADAPNHCQWLAKIIREVESIKVGMTRKDVEKVLREEVGGLVQRRKSLRYQHPDCSYVKLIVSFEAKGENEKDDKVVERSGIPFLDLIPNTKRF